MLRHDLDAVAKNLARRGCVLDRARYRDLEAERKRLQVDVETLRQQRKERSKAIGQAKAAGEDVEPLRAEVGQLGDALTAAEARLGEVAAELEALLTGLPNLLHESVPDGADETSNVEVRRWGEPPAFDFEVRDHVALGEVLGLIDFEAAAKVAGSRFVVLRGGVARLHRALIQFMLDLHTREHGYTEVAVPYLVRDGAMFGSGQLPRFAEDSFQTTTGHWLIPTSEVPLANLVADEILDPDDLPLRYTAGTPCFRSEAGAAGKDTRGMIRQHQFNKVELVSITHPDESEAELERMTRCAEEVLRRLELPYQVVLKCAGDTGFAARKSYDLEVWLPGQGRYREISSCSNCGDFQARRMRARFRPGDERRTAFVHTLNGSGVAVGRTLVALLENFQEADGSVSLPHVLRPYLPGLERLAPGAGM
jgi:seryl-tRNA synthetase